MSLFTNETPGDVLSLEEFQSLTQSSTYSAESLYTMSNEGLLDTLKSFLPEVLRTWFGTAKDLPMDDIKSLPKDQYKFLTGLRKTDYMDFRHLTLTVPAGMYEDYVSFIEGFLEKGVEFLNVQFSRDLDEFVTYTGSLVNKPVEKLKELSSLDKKANERTLTEIKDKLSDYVRRDSAITNVPYQKAIARNKDWETILTKLFSLTQTMNKLNPKEINKKVNRAQQNLVKLNNWLTKEKEGTLVSPEAIRLLADYSLLIAKEAEFFSLIHYLLKVCNVAMENNIQVTQANIKV